jgi:hypothetical protein
VTLLCWQLREIGDIAMVIGVKWRHVKKRYPGQFIEEGRAAAERDKSFCIGTATVASRRASMMCSALLG